MGSAKSIVFRASRRVALSTAGEVVGRSVNLGIPFTLLAIHNADVVTDSFFLAMAIAFFVQGTLANVITNALVPRFIGLEGKLSFHRYASWTMMVAIVAGLLAYLLATSPMLGGSALVAAVSVFFMAASGLLAAPAVAILNAEHKYGAPGITWGFRLVPLVWYLYWWPKSPALHLLLAGIALADIVRSVLLIKLTGASLSFDHAAPPVKFPTAAVHLIIASAIAGFNPLVARLVASLGASGEVSMFEAADRFFNAIVSLATIGVGNVILVYLARLTGSDEEQQGWRWIWWSALSWSLLWLVLCALIWKLFPIGPLLLPNQHDTSAEIVRHTFMALAVGIPGLIMTMIFGRRLLTQNHTRPLIPIAIAGLAYNGIVGVTLFSFYGPVGIAVALSTSHFLVAVLMWRKLRSITGNNRACSDESREPAGKINHDL